MAYGIYKILVFKVKKEVIRVIFSIESFEKPQIQNSLRRTLMRFPSEIGVIQSPLYNGFLEVKKILLMLNHIGRL